MSKPWEDFQKTELLEKYETRGVSHGSPFKDKPGIDSSEWERLFNDALATKDFDRVAELQALEDAYGPGDAIAGGAAGWVAAPTRSLARFLGETAIDPLYEVAIQNAGLDTDTPVMLGAIGGRRTLDNLVDPWKMTLKEFVEQPKPDPLPNDVFYVNGVEVIQNPTPSDYRQLSKEVRSKFPGNTDPTTRFTEDEFGNRFIWKSSDAIHAQLEPSIEKTVGRPVSQNPPQRDKSEHRRSVYKALKRGDNVPANVLDDYKNDDAIAPLIRSAGGGPQMSVDKGPMLKPAVQRRGRVYSAEPGLTHYDAKTPELEADTSGTTDVAGFLTEDGKFLDRRQSLEWLKENDPAAYKNLDKVSRDKGLESMAYSNAKGLKSEVEGLADKYLRQLLTKD